ncbi:MAG: bifunctional (p)ppGpp synthetase/guanosine-3',5'-bis(diphosphate) 3'-pyrophosphohydrolase [Chloroflexi bacterium]|nr:bifunctional (p)ppGpp synthetase/guanosine-3',5'-bis(diphosphate) 3'-pyrophosphohydrolase [Chloroflexota bacterium]
MVAQTTQIQAEHAWQDLLAEVEKYLGPADVETIRRGYAYAAECHAGQHRQSGEDYILHPLAAAQTLAEVRMDGTSIVAALLHDVPEDVGVPLSEIETRFGAEVARLVDGVTKLSKLRWLTIEEGRERRRVDEQALWAENMRKMFLAMAEDIRVVLIKLADRLHNMRTLGHLPPEKRRRIAQETMDIYAPLANRLGIWQVKWQLEDLAFRHLDPEQYKYIATKLASRRQWREGYIQQAISVLKGEFASHGVRAEVSGRPKHIYSIYRKMQSRGVDIDQIYDQLAVRVLVGTVQECYTVLGIVHALWRPLPGQFDDYIATPKESLYQSLHTTVLSLEGKPLEIQIRTFEMHQIAEYGVAAHWRYKEGARPDLKFDAKVAWLRQLMDWQKDVVGGAQEFVESLKTDLFRDQVYVFTPKGEIKELPSGATPIDFAYRVHTEVGHRCVGSKVNGRLVSLDYRLQNGDIVEIITSKGSRGPSRDWLNPGLGYIRTSHAREKVRQWFRRQQRDENILRGRELVEKEIKRLGLDNVKLEDIADAFRYDKLDDFFASVGYGDINPQQIALKLASEFQEPVAPELPPTIAPAQTPVGGIRVLGVGDLLTRLARCCNPVPGEDIIGYITRGRGVTVHRTDCRSVLEEDERDRLVRVDWGRTERQTFPVTIRIEAWDREGLVRDITSVVADEKLNISALSAVTHRDQTATVWATMEVSGLDRLSRVMGRLEAIRDVFNVVRDVGRKAAAT